MFSQIYECCQSKLSSEIISDKYKKRIQKTISLHPASFTIDWFIFECSLDSAGFWGDLSYPLNFLDLKELQKSPTFKRTSQWNKIFAFFSNRKDFYQKRNISHIWIELDSGSSKRWPPIPNLFLVINKDTTNLSEIVQDAFITLMQKKISKSMQKHLNQCITPEIRIFSVGYMLARPFNTLRVCTISSNSLSMSSYINYLKALGL